MGSRLVSRHLLLALAVSLLAHAWLIDAEFFSLPDWLAEKDSIVVTLAPLPPRPQAPPMHTPKPDVPPPAPKTPAKKPPEPAPKPAPTPAPSGTNDLPA